jgi:hypothetical protein
MLGLYESISALATKINRLCCAVKQLQDGGGGSYKVFTALVTWDEEDLINLNVLENTLGGDLVFTAYPPSAFTINSIDNLFTTGKTFVLMNSYYTGGDYGIGTAAECAAVDTINVSFDTYGSIPIAIERTGFIEIRVYI